MIPSDIALLAVMGSRCYSYGRQSLFDVRWVLCASLMDGLSDVRRVWREMQNEAFRLGLNKTGHALNEATQAVGWELAEMLEARNKLYRGEES